MWEIFFYECSEIEANFNQNFRETCSKGSVNLKRQCHGIFYFRFYSQIIFFRSHDPSPPPRRKNRNGAMVTNGVAKGRYFMK